jgi:tetratricopeptide (TPR) repeat protein
MTRPSRDRRLGEPNGPGRSPQPEPLVAAGPGTEYTFDAETLLPVALDAQRMAAAADRMLEVSRESGDALSAAGQASKAAFLFAVAGQHERGERLLREVIGRQDELGATHDHTVSTVRLSQVLQLAARPNEALVLLREVLEDVHQRAELSSLLDFALQHLGKVLYQLGEYAQARAAFAEALQLRRGKGDASLIDSTSLALQAVERAEAASGGR